MENNEKCKDACKDECNGGGIYLSKHELREIMHRKCAKKMVMGILILSLAIAAGYFGGKSCAQKHCMKVYKKAMVAEAVIATSK